MLGKILVVNFLGMKFETTFRVGHRKVHIVYRHSKQHGVKIQRIDWTPSPPKDLRPDELEQYRRGRDALLAEIGAALGGNVLVIET